MTQVVLLEHFAERSCVLHLELGDFGFMDASNTVVFTLQVKILIRNSSNLYKLLLLNCPTGQI